MTAKISKFDPSLADTAAANLITEADRLRAAIEEALKNLPADTKLKMPCGVLSIAVETHFRSRDGATVALNEPRRRILWRQRLRGKFLSESVHILRVISGYDRYEKIKADHLLEIAAELPAALEQYALEADLAAQKLSAATVKLREHSPQKQ